MWINQLIRETLVSLCTFRTDHQYTMPSIRLQIGGQLSLHCHERKLNVH